MLYISGRFFALVLGLSLLSFSAFAGDLQYNMTQGVTEVSRDVYNLHMLIFWICVVIGIGVFGAMFVSMYLHSRKRNKEPSTFHESTKLEILWTVVPALILIGMAVPATSTLKQMYDTSDAELDILITGYQWGWKYEYVDSGVSFFSNLAKESRDQIYANDVEKSENYLLEVDEPLYIPVGKKVRFLVTASDVIHSWWVPDLAVKRDAIPGYINESWTKVEEPGVFRGQCTELCGKDHAYMPVVVHAVVQAEFDAYLATKAEAQKAADEAAKQTLSFEELYQIGEQSYTTNCVACHGMNGEGGVGPKIAGGVVANGPIDAHIDILVNGSANNPMMQSYWDRLNPAEIAAVITFQRNAFGNNTGDVVQPVDVVKYKQNSN